MDRLLKSLSLYILLLCCSGSVFADNGGKVKGRILTGDGTPVIFANILIEGINKGAYTNDRGEFELPIVKPGEYIIRISSVGFVTIRQNVIVEIGKELRLDLTFEEDLTTMPQITILSSRDRLFTKTPGSVSYINSKEIGLLSPISGNEVLRRVSGLHVVDEEGAGMRVNVGIRGLNPDRSRNVLMLEDGIPVALNPYGEPEMYYTPAIDRMSGVEVLKGSGQILYGPQTIGGVINYITADPPEVETFRTRLMGGQGGFFSGLASYGNTIGDAGFQVNFLRKQADNIGPTQFTINDFSGKFKFIFNEKSRLGVKLGLYRENSNATYIGLTQTMYDAGGQDFVRMAPNDELEVSRNSLSFSHDYDFKPGISLKTLAYGFSTDRNWRRQDFSSSPTASNRTNVVWGDPSVPGGAIYMRNSTGNRDRQFEVLAFEQKLLLNYNLGKMENELITGYRIMHEKAYEQRVNGRNATAKSGDLVLDEVRTGNAVSAFAQNQFNLSQNFNISAGLRAEFYDYERDIRRNTFSGVVKDTSIVGSNGISQLIPGLGFNYKFQNELSLFGGLHRGYAPPRVKDAITDQGSVIELDAELSWNYELGFRTTKIKGTFLELTAFLMDFSNQIIPVSESSGGTGAGLVNGGRTRHSGIEGAISIDFADFIDTKHKINYDLNATYVKAIFSEDQFKTVGGERRNIVNNTLPYAPQWILSSALTWEMPFGLSTRLTGTYVSDQFGDEINSSVPSADGRSGPLEAYFLMDATLQYKIPSSNVNFIVSGKNLFNERYIASRRPQGIRVGLPRFITAGVDIKF
jgi:Fe(3+) dicitrate transport protein